MSDTTSIMEYSGTHQAFRNRWAKTDHDMCRHSMSFHLHNTLRKEFFASYLHLLEQTPLGKNSPGEERGSATTQPPASRE